MRTTGAKSFVKATWSTISENPLSEHCTVHYDGYHESGSVDFKLDRPPPPLREKMKKRKNIFCPIFFEIRKNRKKSGKYCFLRKTSLWGCINIISHHFETFGGNSEKTSFFVSSH